MELVFECNASLYKDNCRKVNQCGLNTAGAVFDWFLAEHSKPVDDCEDWLVNYSLFKNEIRRLFGNPNVVRTAVKKMFKLCQGSMSVIEFNVAFNSLAYKVGWNPKALLDFYREELNWKWSGMIEAIREDRPTNHGAWQRQAAKFELNEKSRSSRIAILEARDNAKGPPGLSETPKPVNTLKPYSSNLDANGKLKAEGLQARKDAGKCHRCGKHAYGTPCNAGSIPIKNLKLSKDEIAELSKNC